MIGIPSSETFIAQRLANAYGAGEYVSEEMRDIYTKRYPQTDCHAEKRSETRPKSLQGEEPKVQANFSVGVGLVTVNLTGADTHPIRLTRKGNVSAEA